MTMKAGEYIGALTESLEQTGKEAEKLNKEKKADSRELEELRKEKECVEYERD